MKLSVLRLYLFISSTLALFSCDKIYHDLKPDKDNQDTKYNTHYGPQKEVGEGHARTFAVINHSGVPQEIGVIFTDKALSGLPNVNTLYSLLLPHKAIEVTPFEHVLLGLSAQGHPLSPSGSIAAHFDVRFMMMTQEQRLVIPEPPAPGFDVSPSPGYLPVNYVMNAPLAQIGRHWNYSTVAGTIVNHTMIFGTWNGELTFINPIVTLTTLASGGSHSVLYPQPQYFAKPGYYPTRYNISKDNKGNHYVTLSHFVLR